VSTTLFDGAPRPRRPLAQAFFSWPTASDPVMTYTEASTHLWDGQVISTNGIAPPSRPPPLHRGSLAVVFPPIIFRVSRFLQIILLPYMTAPYFSFPSSRCCFLILCISVPYPHPLPSIHLPGHQRFGTITPAASNEDFFNPTRRLFFRCQLSLVPPSLSHPRARPPGLTPLPE